MNTVQFTQVYAGVRPGIEYTVLNEGLPNDYIQVKAKGKPLWVPKSIINEKPFKGRKHIEEDDYENLYGDIDL